MSLVTVPVTITANDQNGAPVAYAEIVVTLTATEIYGGFVVPERTEAVADANGVCVLQLWPNALGVAGSQYQFKLTNPDTGKRFLKGTATVPNAACNLHEILTPEPGPSLDAAQLVLVQAQGEVALAQTAATSAGNSATAAAASQTSAAGSATAAGNSAAAAATSAADGVAKSDAALKDLVRTYSPTLVYKGRASNGDPAPSSPAVNDCYVVSSTGTAFGIDVEQGQLLIRGTSSWGIGDFSELLLKQFPYSNGSVAKIVDTSRFTGAGYITTSGTVFLSGAGYKYTNFIPVTPGDRLLYYVSASTSIASIAFYDASFALVSAVTGKTSAYERDLIVPATAVYIRLSHLSTDANPPYVNVYKAIKVLADSGFTLTASVNLAKPELIINDFYVASNGVLNKSTGYKSIRIRCIPGVTYTFGNFSVAASVYSAFLDGATNVLQTNGIFNTGTLPKTVTAPAGEPFLWITIATPSNSSGDYASLMVNAGSSLLTYVAPVDSISQINGNNILSQVNPSEYAKLGGNANFASVTADTLTISALTANLPSGPALPAGVSVNQAWIDTTTGNVRVRLS